MSLFGRGVMPEFQMRGGGGGAFTNVREDMLRTAAAGEAMRELRAESNAANLTKFNDSIADIRDLFSEEDQEEDLIEEMIKVSPLDAVAPDIRPSGIGVSPEVDYNIGDMTSMVEESALDTRAATGSRIPDVRRPGGIGVSPDKPKVGAIPKPNSGILSNIFKAGKYANPITAFLGTLLSPTPAGEGSDIVPGMEEYTGMADGGITDESFYINDRPVSEETYNLKGRQMDLNPTGQEAFKAMTEKFSDMDPTTIMDIIEGRFPEYMEDPNDPFAGMADGGRVNYNTGGLTYAYSPFMNMQQGIDYYGQFADAVPRYGQFSPITSPGELVEDGVKSDPTNPIFTDLGTLQGPRGGPEDRGSYADRFGTAEDQGYGYSGTPGKGGSGTFNNPAFGEYGDTFTPGPGIGQAYDEYGRLRDIGVLNDIGLNAYDAMYGAPQQIPGFLGATAALVGSFFDRTEEKKQKEIDEFNEITANQVLERQKKEQEERDAAAAQAAAEQAAADDAAQTAKETYAANQYSGGTGSGDNKPSGTGTFSGGTVSGYTGGAQSPHSSMSTATPSAVAAAQSYAANVAAAQAARDRNKHNRERGGGGGAGKGGGKGCFVKGTMIEMADGTEKEITTITVGELTKGGVVEAKLEFMPTQIYNYKGVEVSGSHLVMENNQFIKVEDSKRSVLTDKIEPVYCFETSDNRIWVKGIEFGDYLTGSHEQWQPHIDAMLETVNLELNAH